jgi:hypothetical protein
MLDILPNVFLHRIDELWFLFLDEIHESCKEQVLKIEEL